MKSIKAYRGFLVFLLCLAVLLPLRTYQLLNDTSPDSNTVAVGSLWSILCIGLMVAALLAIYLIYRLSKEIPSRFTLPHSPLLGVFALLLSAGMAWESLQDITLRNSGMEASAFHTLQILSIAEFIFGIFAVIYFISLAVCCFTSRKNASVVPPAVLSLAAPLWSCLRLVHFYMTLTSTAHLAEAFYDLLFVCAATVFLMAHARLVSGYSSESSGKLAYAFGLIAELLFFSYAVPRLIVGILYRINLAQTSLLSFAVDFLLALYILAFLFRFPRGAVTTASEAEAPAEKAAPSLQNYISDFPEKSGSDEDFFRSDLPPAEETPEPAMQPEDADFANAVKLPEQEPEHGSAPQQEPEYEPESEPTPQQNADEFDLDDILKTYRSK